MQTNINITHQQSNSKKDKARRSHNCWLKFHILLEDARFTVYEDEER